MPKLAGLKKTANNVSKFANESLSDLEKGIKMIKEKIQEERTASRSGTSELEKQITTTQLKIQQIQQDIDSAKATCAARKNEIVNWEKWYETQPLDRKAAAFTKMNSENSWRMSEVNGLQGKISGFESAKLALFVALEKAKEQFAVVREKVHELPIEQDPRLKTLLDAKTILTASLPAKNASKKN